MDCKLYIFGAGGHAKQIIDIFKSNNVTIAGLFDDYKIKNSLFYGECTIIDTIDNADKYINIMDNLFCAIGDNYTRQYVIDKFKNFKFVNCISKLSHISDSAIIGCGNYIGHYVNVSSDVIIGSFNILNDGCFLMHDVQIDDYNHLAPLSTLCGNIKIENSNLIGANSTINPKICIGSNNIIGSGTVIIKNVCNNLTIVGNPGKIVVKQIDK